MDPHLLASMAAKAILDDLADRGVTTSRNILELELDVADQERLEIEWTALIAKHCFDIEAPPPDYKTRLEVAWEQRDVGVKARFTRWLTDVAEAAVKAGYTHGEAFDNSDEEYSMAILINVPKAVDGSVMVIVTLIEARVHGDEGEGVSVRVEASLSGYADETIGIAPYNWTPRCWVPLEHTCADSSECDEEVLEDRMDLVEHQINEFIFDMLDLFERGSVEADQENDDVE